ncbi:MAG: hypothetical protein GW827_05560 [Flavobacteriales bacterium]|nr:hypothetical protein [Flavobacteriales bacterium]
MSEEKEKTDNDDKKISENDGGENKNSNEEGKNDKDPLPSFANSNKHYTYYNITYYINIYYYILIPNL